MNARLIQTSAIPGSAIICLGAGNVHVQKGTITMEQIAAKDLEMLAISLRDFFFSILH